MQKLSLNNEKVIRSSPVDHLSDRGNELCLYSYENKLCICNSLLWFLLLEIRLSLLYAQRRIKKGATVNIDQINKLGRCLNYSYLAKKKNSE